MASNLDQELNAINEHCSYKRHPVFRLNVTRRKYLNIFIDDIKAGNIKLKHVNSCLCGSNKIHKIASQDRFGLPFSQLICKDCGLLNTTPKIDNGDIEYYYKRIYHPLVVGIESGESVTYSFSDEQGGNIFVFLKKYLLDLGIKDLNIVEIGCAAGDNLISLQDRLNKHGITSNLYGTEYQSDLANIAISKGVKIIGAIEDLSSNDIKFHLVVMSHVFEHLFDPKSILEIIKKKIYKEGLLYIEVPGISNLEMINLYYGGDINDYFIHSHFYNFNLNSLTSYLNINGFKLLFGNERVQSIFIPCAINKNHLKFENYKNVLLSIYAHQILRINNISRFSLRNFKNMIVNSLNRRILNSIDKFEI